MMKKSLIIRLFSLVFLLLWILTGCGNTTEPEENQQQDVKQPNGEQTKENTSESNSEDTKDEDLTESKEVKAEWDVSKLQRIDGFSDILDKFSLISYAFETPESSMNITMQLIGEEEINGKLTNHIKVNMKDSTATNEVIELWINEEGDTEKLVSGTEVMEGEVLKMAGKSYVMLLLMPFNMTEGMNIKNILNNDKQHPNVTVSKVGDGEKKIGDTKMNTYNYQVTNEGQSSTWEIGDLGPFQLLTSWTMNENGKKSSFEVLNLKLRD
ncbi:hypothetical protein GLW08_16685 [Pontibacillus yanchengensis]|uniref:Uncharacterized protein n=2 Tax=Pontibacillus yanchengensis TaxID=462910 RepID=A0ACC7VJK8_9BACI|nr:hypothetical protein [Pontibacillus yanchengensis]MYL32578.1 hypothetical protein [Pontibacillus yanchengensis]MYL54972.1 hypothetical protein [Pontibacillus yanchengensis]